MSSKAVYIKSLFLISLSLWCLGIVFPVLFHSGDAILFSNIFLKKIYSQVCHQDPLKSIYISGQKLEVCARCTGIYAGSFISSIVVLFFPKIKPQSVKFLFISMVPMAADVFLYSTGVYNYSKWIAFSTGLILGSVSILYIFTTIENYFSELTLNSNVQ